jgi:hypothetical protein
MKGCRLEAEEGIWVNFRINTSFGSDRGTQIQLQPSKGANRPKACFQNYVSELLRKDRLRQEYSVAK